MVNPFLVQAISSWTQQIIRVLLHHMAPCCFLQWGKHLKEQQCGFFRRKLGALEPHGEGRLAVAAAVGMWLQLEREVCKSQDVKWQPSHRVWYYAFLGTTRILGKYLFTSIIQSKCCTGFSDCIVYINSILSSIVSPDVKQIWRLLNHHSRCLFKEHIFHSPFSILQLYWSILMSTKPPGLLEVMNPKRCFPHRNHKVNVTSNQSSEQQSGNHLTNILHKQNN